jgi:HD-GYP domain-containing protein (c-di-GMP phosphodiesterase class II)
MDELPTQPDVPSTDVRRSEHEAEYGVLVSALGAVAGALEHRDPETVRHQRRVGALAQEIGRALGLSPDDCCGLRIAGELHDIGKWAIPEELLGKPGPLSESEFAVVACHATTGYDLLRHVSFPWPVALAVHQHHERMDGSGYPLGLRGEDICIEARIIAVADVLDAMSSDRPYRDGVGLEHALKYLAECAHQFDARIVEACIRHLSLGEGAVVPA